jgi:hypothetical protein
MRKHSDRFVRCCRESWLKHARVLKGIRMIRVKSEFFRSLCHKFPRFKAWN